MANLQVGVAGNGTVTVGAGASVHSPASNTLTLGTNNSERLRIDSSGRVGIGTVPVSSEGAELSIRSSDGQTNVGLLPNTDSESSQLTFYNASNDSAQGYIRYDNSDNSLQVRVNLAERLRITSSGQLVMGATTSKAKFEIKDNGYTTTSVIARLSTDDASPYALVIANDTCSGTATQGMQFFVNNGGDHYIRCRAHSTAGNNNLLILAQNDLRLHSGASETEALEIDSSQRINIGGVAVSQTRNVNIASNAEANLAIETHNTSASETANIRFYRSRGTGASPTTLVDNDVISQLMFYGHDGTDYAHAAALIKVECDGTVAGNQMPGAMTFHTNSGTTSATERLRIRPSGQVDFASRNFTMGSGASDDGSSVGITGNAWSNNEIGIKMSHGVTGGQSYFVFYNPNGQVGYIQSSGSGTIYNTGSDHRLKENQVLISDGITRLKQLKPYRFNFKKDPSTTLDGFFAHEVQSVVPEAIAGTKDEVATKDEGDRKTGDPIYQGMDYGRITPLLAAALQEAVAKIETLETEVAALKSS